MNPAEKRRGGGAGRTAVRQQPGHAAASHNSSNSSQVRDNAKDKDDNKGLPAMPPRAAVSNSGNTTASPDEPHDGGVSLQENDSTASCKAKDSQNREKEGHGSGAARSGSSSPSRHTSNPRGKQQQQQQQLLRERDDRIAALQNELTIMETEFHRELDKLSQSESETATFWQSKHSALNQQFLRTDTELRLLRSEVEVREAERDELRQRWEVLRREVRERDEEIRGLRGQVRGLKDFVSTSTRTDGQMSDEVFGDGMARLGNGLQNWVINNFRKAKMDLGKVDEATEAELTELVPMYEELSKTSKVYLLQSIVSSILVQMVFSSYYPGLSEEQTSQFRKMEELLSSFTDADETVNQWRSSTLALIRREAPQRLSDETGPFALTVVTRINRILNAMTTASPTGEARDSALRVLVDSAIDLARLLAVQKAVLRVYFPTILPHQSVPFEAETMEDIGGEDEDSLAGREISCVAFPGIIKNGDESGGHLQYRNVISKARVLCRPED